MRTDRHFAAALRDALWRIQLDVIATFIEIVDRRGKTLIVINSILQHR